MSDTKYKGNFDISPIGQLFDLQSIVAKYGHLELMIWLEERNILPTTKCSDIASGAGYINILDWLESRYIIPIFKSTITVAKFGYLDVLKWFNNRNIFQSNDLDKNIKIANIAAQHGHLNILNWLVNNFNILLI
uniref:Ankyrin repeat protein n=1 Tax=Pithovirus LCPAC102 TaxID=2506587 RepID=A0A481Z4C4_9VIRU|nr:MAG: hypothetical protein LCPAC102_02150 [Pithovirus LCPAC102]